MNQILNTREYTNKNKFKQKLFKMQLCFSIFCIFLIIIIIFAYLTNLSKKEKLSNNLMKNYNVYKLYYSNISHDSNNVSNYNNTIFGIIEIPNLNIYYPIFSNFNEELLKISPCKVFGSFPSQDGNICIAGHNYNNSMFFSNLYKLNINDKIYIYDIKGTEFIYKTNKIYEVSESDLSPIFDYEKSEKTLTLITCNNNNSNRIIVRAKQY